MTIPTNGNGNGKNTWNAIIGGLGGVVIVVAIVNAFTSPIELRINENRSKIEKVENWEHDYMMGKIPSSAEKEIMAVKEVLIEKETQITKNLESQQENKRIQEEKNKMYDELLIKFTALESFARSKLNYK